MAFSSQFRRLGQSRREILPPHQAAEKNSRPAKLTFFSIALQFSQIPAIMVKKPLIRPAFVGLHTRYFVTLDEIRHEQTGF